MFTRCESSMSAATIWSKMKFAPNDGRIKLRGRQLVARRMRITVGPIWTHKVRTTIPRPSASDRIMVAAGLQGLTPPGSPAPPDYSESPPPTLEEGQGGGKGEVKLAVNRMSC